MSARASIINRIAAVVEPKEQYVAAQGFALSYTGWVDTTGSPVAADGFGMTDMLYAYDG